MEGHLPCVLVSTLNCIFHKDCGSMVWKKSALVQSSPVGTGSEVEQYASTFDINGTSSEPVMDNRNLVADLVSPFTMRCWPMVCPEPKVTQALFTYKSTVKPEIRWPNGIYSCILTTLISIVFPKSITIFPVLVPADVVQ